MTSFTVAIPTHNRRETALMAVQSVLRQTHAAREVFVICDGCTDGTQDAIRALGERRVSVIDLEKGEGYAYAHRNVAIERAKGDVITWLADDDLLLPDHLRRLAKRWAVGDADLVTTPAVIVEPDDRLRWIGRDWSVASFREWVLERENTNVMASVSVRTDLVRAVGGWDGSVPRAADWELWKRVLSAGARAVMTDEPTVLHFKATGRNQAWPLRVRQNAAWLERLCDPVQLREVRRTLRRTRSELEAQHWSELQRVHASNAELLAAAARREQYVEELQAAVAGGQEREAALHRHITAIEQDRASIAEQLRAAQADAERARVGLERAAATLQAIYNGGWWRLRARLRPVLRPAAALRRGTRLLRAG